MGSGNGNRRALKSAILKIGGTKRLPPRRVLNRIALKASKVADHVPAWTGSFLYILLHPQRYPNYKLNYELLAAVLQVANDPALAGTHTITLRVANGRVRPGALVQGRSRKCARGRCRVWFVPAGNATFCSDACRNRILSYRAKQRHKRKGAK